MKHIVYIVAVLFALVARAATTNTVVTTTSVPAAFAPWTNSVAVPKFDASLGTLRSAQFVLSVTNSITGKVESTDSSPGDFTITDTVTTTGSVGTNSMVISTGVNFAFSLGAYDGITDFGGTSGAIQSATQNAQTAKAIPNADVSGTGTIPVAIRASAVSDTTIGDGMGLVLTKSGATLVVTYTYTNP